MLYFFYKAMQLQRRDSQNVISSQFCVELYNVASIYWSKVLENHVSETRYVFLSISMIFLILHIFELWRQKSTKIIIIQTLRKLFYSFYIINYLQVKKVLKEFEWRFYLCIFVFQVLKCKKFKIAKNVVSFVLI